MKTSIIINQLEKRYRNQLVLKDISFEFEKGVLGILGENGAGKTTLLKILATALKKDKGKVVICGKDIDRNFHEVCSDIGYLPQNFGFFKYQKLYEGMSYIAMLKGMHKSNLDEIEKLLRLVRLYEQRDKMVGELSGGMLQRFGIAQSLLNKPSLLIMDEPTSGLDPGERIHFRNIIKSLDWECSVVISSHNVRDIEFLSDDVMLLRRGEMLYYGSQEDALQKMQQKVVIVKQDIGAPVAWEKNVISIRKRYQTAEIRMIFDDSIMVEKFQGNVTDTEPTLEDFYFYKMYLSKEGKCGSRL